jgi:PAS domain S-box-containing protein
VDKHYTLVDKHYTFVFPLSDKAPLISFCFSIMFNRAESRFENIFNHVNEGIMICNQMGQIIITNPKCNAMFGYEVDELNGRLVEALVPSKYTERHVEHRESYMRHPVRRPMGNNMTLFGRRKDGSEFPVEVSLSYYETAEGMFVIGFIIDISERFEQQKNIIRINQELKQLNENLENKVNERTLVLKEALTELEASRDELEQSLEKEKELNEMKSRFITMASHEFRTPLSTILSSASLISKYMETTQQEHREKHVGRIKSAVNGLTEILNDFLSIGKLEEGKVLTNWSMIDVRLLLEEVIDDLQVLCKDGQTIELKCEKIPLWPSDRGLLKNMMVNLVSNAIKFSNEHSVVKINAAMVDGFLNIAVKDQGIGISDEDKRHLYERFFRGKNAQNIQGTGLGLHIITKYLELLGGEIQVESALQKGTTFIVRLSNKTFVS